MNTYLLTWNPKRWNWDMDEDLASINTQGFSDGRWSCGRTRRIEPEDRIYLLRQGVEPRGIVASGYAKSTPYEDDHWDINRKDKALYIDVRLDTLLVPEKEGILPLVQLQKGYLAEVNWNTQSSGISISSNVSDVLDRKWRDFLEEHGQSPISLPDEVLTPTLYYEGACRRVTVNAYERNPRARKVCIEHYGTKCFICGFDFGTVYGSIGECFIHVHHIVPLSDIGKTYKLDPVLHMRPVCPNCHAMLHRSPKVMSVEELQAIVQLEQ
ncbi:MAG: HNH endonuclease [Candidatus Hydrogenedentes bacterium ADurb.Bin179]|nr:MAG: HNH endonuclease [Candidatus Hydrogenedentes bacterium ADurb.Bin179]